MMQVPACWTFPQVPLVQVEVVHASPSPVHTLALFRFEYADWLVAVRHALQSFDGSSAFSTTHVVPMRQLPGEMVA